MSAGGGEKNEKQMEGCFHLFVRKPDIKVSSIEKPPVFARGGFSNATSQNFTGQASLKLLTPTLQSALELGW